MKSKKRGKLNPYLPSALYPLHLSELLHVPAGTRQAAIGGVEDQEDQLNEVIDLTPPVIFLQYLSGVRVL